MVQKLTALQTEHNLYIVTERVVPLSWPVKRRSLSEETAKWGLYTVAVRYSWESSIVALLTGIARDSLLSNS